MKAYFVLSFKVLKKSLPLLVLFIIINAFLFFSYSFPSNNNDIENQLNMIDWVSLGLNKNKVNATLDQVKNLATIIKFFVFPFLEICMLYIINKYIRNKFIRDFSYLYYFTNNKCLLFFIGICFISLSNLISFPLYLLLNFLFYACLGLPVILHPTISFLYLFIALLLVDFAFCFFFLRLPFTSKNLPKRMKELNL